MTNETQQYEFFYPKFNHICMIPVCAMKSNIENKKYVISFIDIA